MKYLFLLLLLSFNLFAQTIYKTIPNTPYKDITEPVMVIEKNVIYQTIPNTSFKDSTEPIFVIEKNGIYPTRPGTTLRDYSVMPQFVIE